MMATDNCKYEKKNISCIGFASLLVSVGLKVYYLLTRNCNWVECFWMLTYELLV